MTLEHTPRERRTEGIGLSTVHPGGGRRNETSGDPLTGLASGLLRDALRATAADSPGFRGRDREVRAQVRTLCAAARVGGLRAEQLLILLKEAWRDLPEARRAARDHDGSCLTRVITLCIEEFYAPSRQT